MAVVVVLLVVVLVATLGAKANGCPPDLPQGTIHLGGDLALPIPTTTTEDLEVADESGTVPTDGSLGTAGIRPRVTGVRPTGTGERYHL